MLPFCRQTNWFLLLLSNLNVQFIQFRIYLNDFKRFGLMAALHGVLRHCNSIVSFALMISKSVDTFEYFSTMSNFKRKPPWWIYRGLESQLRLHTAVGHNMYRTDYYSKKDLGCPKAFLTIVLTYIFLELLWRIPKRAKDNHWLIGWIIDHLSTYRISANSFRPWIVSSLE